MFEKALYHILQAYLFVKKAARTNMINRLIVIVTEDIAIEETEVLLMSEEHLKPYLLPEEKPELA